MGLLSRCCVCCLAIGIILCPVETFALDAVDVAVNQLGKPYDWGGNGPDAFDCSGLTQYSFGQVGIVLPRTSLAQSQIGDPVVGPLQRGDLLFFTTDDEIPGVVTHVGVYEGNNQMIQAQWYDVDVVRSDITSSYWSSHFLFARRVTGTGVVFSNFGPGDTYLIAGGWGVNSAGPNVPYTSDAGESFVPAGNVRLDRIEIAIGIAEGADNFSPNEVNVMLMTDENGAPGTVIEAFRFSGLGLAGTVRPPLAKDSLLRPVLGAGTRYWLVASAPLPNSFLAWHQNVIGSLGLHACRSTSVDNCVGIQIGDWLIHNDFQGAFRVSGTPVP